MANTGTKLPQLPQGIRELSPFQRIPFSKKVRETRVDTTSWKSGGRAVNGALANEALKGVLAGARILIVEDDFLIAMQLQSLFEEEGAEVIGPCYTLADALQVAQDGEFSAASLDLNLGRDVATPVAQLLSDRKVPFVFYSVQTNDPALAGWRHIRLLQKPARTEELVAAMAMLIAKRNT